MLLDPFYGVFTFGKRLTRWLNRFLILAEGYGIYWGINHYITQNQLISDIKFWVIPLCIIIAFIGIAIVNAAVRFLWNIVLTFVYGTTDAETIIELRQRRLQRRSDRQIRRMNRLTSGWTRADIVNSKVLDNRELLSSPSLYDKAAKGRKALAKL